MVAAIEANASTSENEIHTFKRVLMEIIYFKRLCMKTECNVISNKVNNDL